MGRMWGTPIIALAAAIIVAGCAGSTFRRTNASEPTLTQTVDAQIAKEEAIVWTLRRRLTWADFKGQPPENAGLVAARTNYAIINGVG